MGRSVLLFLLLLAVPVFAGEYDVVDGFEKTTTQDWLSVRYGFNSIELDSFEIKMLKVIEFAEVKDYDASLMENVFEDFADLHAELAVYISDVNATDEGYEELWSQFKSMKDDFRTNSQAVIVDESERAEARRQADVAVALMQNSFDNRFSEAKGLMSVLSFQHFDWEVALINNITSTLESRGIDVSSFESRISDFSNRRSEISPVFEKEDFFEDWQELKESVQEEFHELLENLKETGLEYLVEQMLENADAAMKDVRNKFEEVKSEIESQGLSIDFSDDELYLDSVEAKIEELKNELTSENRGEIKNCFENEVVPMYLELKRRMVYKVYLAMANTFSQSAKNELDNLKSNAEREGVSVDFSDIESELDSLVSELEVLAGESAEEQSQTMEDNGNAKRFEVELQPRFERLFVKAQIRLYSAYGEKIKSHARETFNNEIEKARANQNLTIDSSAIDEKLDEIDGMIDELELLEDSASPEELKSKVEDLRARVEKVMRKVHVILVEELAETFIGHLRSQVVSVKKQFAEKGIELNSSLVDGELFGLEDDVENLKIAIRKNNEGEVKDLENKIQTRFQNFQKLAVGVLFTQLLNHQYSAAEGVIQNHENAGRDVSAYKAELVVVKGVVDECQSKFNSEDYDWVSENCNLEKVFMKMNQLGRENGESSDVI